MSDLQLYAILRSIRESLTECIGLSSNENYDEIILSVMDTLQEIAESLLPQENK